MNAETFDSLCLQTLFLCVNCPLELEGLGERETAFGAHGPFLTPDTRLAHSLRAQVLPQLINFALVPPFARVAFANAVALVWNVILSVIANSA